MPSLLRPLETAVLAGIFVLAFRFPGALGGWLEPAMALLFPLLLLEGLFKGRHAVWTWAAILAGLLLLYMWVPQTLASKGGLPFGLALLGTVLLSLWEATGLWLVALGSRWAFRRIGALGAACVAALLLLGWEAWGFHVYPWTWGAAFGSLPGRPGARPSWALRASRPWPGGRGPGRRPSWPTVPPCAGRWRDRPSPWASWSSWAGPGSSCRGQRSGPWTWP